MVDIKFTISAAWFTGPDNSDENVSEEKTGTLEEIIEWMKGVERSREAEAEREEGIISENEEDAELD